MDFPQLGTLFRCGPKGESIGAQLIIYKDEETYIGRDNTWYVLFNPERLLSFSGLHDYLTSLQ